MCVTGLIVLFCFLLLSCSIFHSVGKPKWQVQKDHKEAEQRVRELEEEIAMMKNKDAAESSEERELPPKTNLPADTGGCNCVVM